MSEKGQQVKWLDKNTFAILSPDDKSEVTFTTDRDLARAEEGLELMGLDHPLMLEALKRWQGLDPEIFGVAVDGIEGPAVLSWWLIHTQGKNGEHRSFVQPLAVGTDGKRVPKLERKGIDLLKRQPGPPALSTDQRREILHDTLEPMIQRELHHRGLVPKNGGYSSKLIGWVEVGGESAGNGASP